MIPKPTPFSKYDEMGAYHWVECDRRSTAYNPPLEARYQVVLKRLKRAKRVLDVGCGDGYLMSLVSPLCDQAMGIDIERAGIAIAATKLQPLGNCVVIQGSCYDIPFASGCFEVVVLADVIEHLEAPEICLKEINRVLMPDGTLLVTTPKRRPDRKLGWGHVREYTGEELADCLRFYFLQVTLAYLWPSRWRRLYRTRIGWRLIRIFARYLYNPFLREGANPEGYDQILAICEQPRG